jgi:16S rRNA processing protein RimM
VSPTEPERLIEIGVVGRPHGIRGEVRVFLHNPASDLLQNLDRVRLQAGDAAPREHRLERARPAGRHQLVAFAEIDSRDAAGQLKGARILVPRSELPRLGDDEFYVDDLIGLQVVCEKQRLGTVSASREQGGIEVLTVESSGEEIEIPVVEQFVAAVRIAEGQIDVRDLDNLPRTRTDRSERDDG